MRLTKYFLSSLCICGILSCSQDRLDKDSKSDLVEMTLEATFADEAAETKTIRNDDGSTFWSDGDQISLFFGTGSDGGSCFTTQVGGETASFTGMISAFTAGGEGYTGETTYFWGVYPYKSTTTCDNESITIDIPSVQPGVAGTFAPGVNLSVGRSENLKMGFYNICSGFSFSVSTSGLTELKVESLDGTSIAGRAKVQFVDGKPSATLVSEQSDNVTIIPEGGEFEVGKKYYLEFIPITLSGFKVTLYNDDLQEVEFPHETEPLFPISN